MRRLPPLSVADTKRAQERAGVLFARYTGGEARIEWRPDNPETFRRNLVRSQYAELAVARFLGRPVTSVESGSRMRPDILPDIEVRATTWSILRPLLSGYAIDVPPSCLPFYERKDRGREGRRFVLVAVGGSHELKLLGWAWGRDIIAQGERFTRGWYLDPLQLQDELDLLETDA